MFQGKTSYHMHVKITVKVTKDAVKAEQAETSLIYYIYVAKLFTQGRVFNLLLIVKLYV